jgi:hypothetical protein
MPPLAELKILNPSQAPEANSQTYEKYYEVEEGLKQHVCSPKLHVQNSIQRKGALLSRFYGKNNTFHCRANCAWLSYLLLT